MPLTRRKVVLAKAEATYATDPTHAAADAVLVHDFDFTFNGERYGRAVNSASLVARRASVLGKRSVSISFWQEMIGDAADYGAGARFPKYDAMIKACGFTRTDDGGDPRAYTYRQDRDGFGSVAFEFEADGIVCIALGCRGNARFVLTPGERARIEYTFQGLFTLPADRAPMTTPSYTGDVAPPIVATTGFQPWTENPAAGAFGHARSMVVDCRNIIEPRESLTAGAEGVAAFEIVGFGSDDDPGSQVELEFEQKASTNGDDFFTRWNSRTRSGSSSAALGSAAGNTHTLTVNDLIIDDIQFGDFGGRLGNVLDCRVVGEAAVPAAAAEDGITLVAT